MTKFEERLDAVRVVPDRGGRFEVTFDGELIYSKLATHRHAEPGEVSRLITERLKKA